MRETNISELRVSLFGKHPSSSEYLYLGDNSPFTDAIVSWVKAGYEVLLKNRQKYPSDISHHLYFLNKEINRFVCATLKISRDAKGREYPLVILVEGTPVKDYQAIWRTNLEVFETMHSVVSLKELLPTYKVEMVYENGFVDLDEEALAMFVNEDFSKNKQFYKSLQVNDFIEMMR